MLVATDTKYCQLDTKYIISYRHKILPTTDKTFELQTQNLLLATGIKHIFSYRHKVYF